MIIRATADELCFGVELENVSGRARKRKNKIYEKSTISTYRDLLWIYLPSAFLILSSTERLEQCLLFAALAAVVHVDSPGAAP
jgi:hypothetical protein